MRKNGLLMYFLNNKFRMFGFLVCISYFKRNLWTGVQGEKSDKAASHLDILLSFDVNNLTPVSLYDKHDDFKFHISNLLS